MPRNPERVAELRAAGVCGQCWRNQSRPGKRTCSDCAVRCSQRAVADRRARGKGERWVDGQVIGQRFGRLAVVERAGSEGGRRAWLCRCDCGQTRRLTLHALRDGARCLACATGQGILARLEGQTVGRTRVLYRDGNVWVGRCECGRIRRAPTKELRRSGSCGCVRSCRSDERVPLGSPALREHWERVLAQEGLPAELRYGRLVLTDPAIIDDAHNRWRLEGR